MSDTRVGGPYNGPVSYRPSQVLLEWMAQTLPAAHKIVVGRGQKLYLPVPSSLVREVRINHFDVSIFYNQHLRADTRVAQEVVVTIPYRGFSLLWRQLCFRCERTRMIQLPYFSMALPYLEREDARVRFYLVLRLAG